MIDYITRPFKIQVLQLLLTLSIGGHFCCGQTKTDSLLHALESHPYEDTLKVKILLELAEAHTGVSPRKVESYCSSALELSEKLDYQWGFLKAMTELASVYISQGHLEKGMEYAHLTLQKSQEAGLLSWQGQAQQLMGLVLYHQGDLKQAKFFFKEALTLYRQFKNERHIASVLSNIGGIYAAEDDPDSALNYYYQVGKMDYVQKNKIYLGTNMHNIGSMWQDKKVFDKAIAVYLQSLDIKKESGNREGAIITLENLGSIYRVKKDYDIADQYLQKGLEIAQELNLLMDQLFLYERLLKLEKDRGNHLKVVDYYEKYLVLKDSIFNEQKAKQIAELQTQYETEKKEQQIAALQLKNEVQSLWQYVLIGVLIVVGLMLLFIYLFYRYRNQKNHLLLLAQQTQTRQLQALDRMKSQFFANISHEFRTPLSLILSPLDGLFYEVGSEKGKEQLGVIQRNAKRLLKLINQLLELSKIESGNTNLQASMENIVPLVRGLLFSFQSLAEKENVLLDFQCEEEEIFLYVETGKIEQVINNLISNAVKFTPPHGKITVLMQRVQANGDEQLEIVVKDTGPGIPLEKLPHIFDRFFQADNSDTREYEGTGIGLALAKEFVELHHGKIYVDSESAQGATFRIHLPFGRDHLSDKEIVTITKGTVDRPLVESLEEKHPGAVSEEARLGPDKPLILVIEDNTDLREYVSNAFEGEYRIEQAVNGKEGLEQAFESIPDLIISDIMMPKMDGATLCRKLKNDHRTSHIPIILLTAKANEEDKLAGLECQADDYLVKPFNTKELIIRAKNLIDLRQKLRDQLKKTVILKPNEMEVSSMDQALLEKLMKILEEHISNEQFGVVELSREIGMSRVHLHRKLQALIGQSPSLFIRDFRLQRGMDLLQKNAATISEIAFEVGFSSPAYFSKCFSEKYGYSPKEVKPSSGN